MADKDLSIAKKMKFFRALQHITQEELSKRCGIEYSQIRRYESGARMPKLEQLQSIASALGVGVSEFTDLVDDSAGSIISLLLKLDEKTDLNWECKKNKNGDCQPSSIKLSFNDTTINESLALYLKYRELIRTGDKNDIAYTDDDGKQITIEQLRGKILIDHIKKEKFEA